MCDNDDKGMAVMVMMVVMIFAIWICYSYISMSFLGTVERGNEVIMY